MKYYNKEKLKDMIDNFGFEYTLLPNGYGKVFAYCAKIFRDNDCELVNLYVDTDIIAFIFKKNGVYNSSNCSIKYYSDFLDSAKKNDFESSVAITLKVITKIAYTWEVKS